EGAAARHGVQGVERQVQHRPPDHVAISRLLLSQQPYLLAYLFFKGMSLPAFNMKEQLLRLT
ncbi:hypothetical protein KJ708_02775, partial [bacterium]|nr:hypothetical protein [bacterium]